MNIQQIIIKGIRERLFFNNYLVLPDFGGFVLKSVGAHYSATGGSLMPPSKTVSFNAQLKQNDGILVSWLQKELSCPFSESQQHLKDFSEFCTSVLTNKRRLSLEGVGFFFLDFENNICFEPQHDANFLSSSFGLGPLALQTIEPEQKAVKRDLVFTDRVVSTDRSPEIKQKWRFRVRELSSYAFAGFVVISLLFLLVANSRISGELRSSLFAASPVGNYTPLPYPVLEIKTAAPINAAYVADANGIAVLELPEEKKLSVKAVDTFVESSASVSSELKSYQVVLGCFSVHKNALRMQKKLLRQNIKTTVLQKNSKGLYVVSYGAFVSKSAAADQLANVKAKFPKAWIKQPD